MKEEFVNTFNKHAEILERYVPIVARVHGSTHPEFLKVQELYNLLNENIKDENNLDQIFNDLKEVTNNYEVPSDACESYALVYNMLEDLHKSYEL